MLTPRGQEIDKQPDEQKKRWLDGIVLDTHITSTAIKIQWILTKNDDHHSSFCSSVGHFIGLSWVHDYAESVSMSWLHHDPVWLRRQAEHHPRIECPNQLALGVRIFGTNSLSAINKHAILLPWQVTGEAMWMGIKRAVMMLIWWNYRTLK